jgi:hypothetical protein
MLLPKHILKKNTVFRKKGVKIWTFDGTNCAVLFEGGASRENRDNVGTQHGGMLSIYFYCFSKDIFCTTIHLLHKNIYEKSCLLLSS